MIPDDWQPTHGEPIDAEKAERLAAQALATQATNDLRAILNALARKPRWHPNYKTGQLTIDIAHKARLNHRHTQQLLAILETTGHARRTTTKPTRWTPTKTTTNPPNTP